MEQEALTRAARNGDEEAFIALMSAQKEKLYRMAFAYLRNEDDAIEAVQETAYRAWKSIRRLKDDRLFGTWIVRILMNCCHDEWKRRKRLEQTAAACEEIRGESPEGSWALRLQMSEAMAQLEPKYRQLIVLKYFEDMTLSEIAAAMDRPLGTVKTRLHQALRRLRTLIADKGEMG